MRLTRLASVIIGLSLLAPLSAYGAEALNVTSSCKSGDKKCVSDVQKRWQLEKDKFERSLDAKKKKWLEENPPVISTEYRLLQRAFADSIRAEALKWRNDQRAKEKAFYDALKKEEQKGDTRLRATGSPRLLPGQDSCDQTGNPEVFRICMREYRVKYLLEEKARQYNSEE